MERIWGKKNKKTRASLMHGLNDDGMTVDEVCLASVGSGGGLHLAEGVEELLDLLDGLAAGFARVVLAEMVYQVIDLLRGEEFRIGPQGHQVFSERTKCVWHGVTSFWKWNRHTTQGTVHGATGDRPVNGALSGCEEAVTNGKNDCHHYHENRYFVKGYVATCLILGSTEGENGAGIGRARG